MGRKIKVPKREYFFIDYDDTTIRHDRILYKASCPRCGSDRGYKRPNKFNSVCKECHRERCVVKMQSKECVAKRSKSMKNKTPWNKGLTKNDHVGLLRISKKMKNRKVHDITRIKCSCSQRKICVDDFDGFYNTENDRDKQKIKGYRLNIECFKKADFTCDCCGRRSCELNAHHKNGFNWCVEKRFDVENLVCLCKECHYLFHKKYNKRDNTEEQYIEFKNYINKVVLCQ